MFLEDLYARSTLISSRLSELGFWLLVVLRGRLLDLLRGRRAFLPRLLPLPRLAPPLGLGRPRPLPLPLGQADRGFELEVLGCGSCELWASGALVALV